MLLLYFVLCCGRYGEREIIHCIVVQIEMLKWSSMQLNLCYHSFETVGSWTNTVFKMIFLSPFAENCHLVQVLNFIQMHQYK